MKTILRTMAVVALIFAALSPRPAQAQVSVGIATPGFSLGVGPGAGYIAGGYLPGYPVVAPPIYAPRPVVVAPPIYGGYYGGYYGRGYYGPGRPGPYRYAPPRVYRR